MTSRTFDLRKKEYQEVGKTSWHSRLRSRTGLVTIGLSMIILSLTGYWAWKYPTLQTRTCQLTHYFCPVLQTIPAPSQHKSEERVPASSLTVVIPPDPPPIIPREVYDWKEPGMTWLQWLQWRVDQYDWYWTQQLCQDQPEYCPPSSPIR